MIKSDNTIQIIEQNIYKFYGGQIPLSCCNEIANNILNDFEYNDFDFAKELFKVAKPSKADMINRYITGKITKQQLDEFMKRYKA